LRLYADEYNGYRYYNENQLLDKEYYSFELSLNKGLYSITELLGFAAGGVVVGM
jgi:hypothetical protein